MRRLLISSALLGLLASPALGLGETLYVDNELTQDCTSYDPAAGRGDPACAAGSSQAYVKIQDAILSMTTGDTIYMRGGRYHETNAYPDGMIDIPPALSGDSWEEGHFNTLASYPGEWAILDGEFTAPKGVVLGHKGMSSGDWGYWKFERFEITGGCSPGDDANGGAGLWLTRGPFIIRYLYLHDNWDDNILNNPSGITAYRLVESTIEFTWLHRNGHSGQNGGAMVMYPDYDDESQGQNDLQDIGRAQHSNTIRYNYFSAGGGYGGIKNKGSQMLGPNIEAAPDGGGWPRQELGDRIHHNIFTDFVGYSANLRQDFVQFYQNVLDGTNMSSSEYNQYGRRRQCFYNNTILSAGFFHRNKETPTLWVPPAYYAEDYVLNNIFDRFTGGQGGIAYPMVYRPDASPGVTSGIASAFDRGGVDHNYIYAPEISGPMVAVATGRAGQDAHFGTFTIDEYDAMFGAENYQKPSSEGSDDLMVGSSGADRYVTRGSHVVEGATTIVDGGTGGPHPYLPGVELPAFLGAANPLDHQWIDGVLSDVGSVAWLQAQGEAEPSWVEGSEGGGGGGGGAPGGGGPGGGGVGAQGTGAGGSQGAAVDADDESEGCGCRVVARRRRPAAVALLLLGACVALGRRRLTAVRRV